MVFGCANTPKGGHTLQIQPTNKLVSLSDCAMLAALLLFCQQIPSHRLRLQHQLIDEIHRTPLIAGIVSNIVHLGLDVALVFWLGLGVTGAALATSLSHWLTLLILAGMVINKGYLQLPDLARPPRWEDVEPMLRNGLLLSTRSILGMSVLLFATQLIAGFGAVSMAAHEILRQIWVFSNQAFTSLDIATQSLVAFFLGRGDRASAAGVFRRTLTLATSVAVLVTLGLLLGQQTLPAIFSRDAAVIEQVAALMPLIAVFMPLDAAASVMDGVLLGSQEASWLSKTMMVTSGVAAVGLLTCQRFGFQILAVWATIKLLTVGRLIGNAWRLWSPDGPLGQHLHNESKGVPGFSMAAAGSDGSGGREGVSAGRSA
jgi:Na+-driven multidrug efflux pump